MFYSLLKDVKLLNNAGSFQIMQAACTGRFAVSCCVILWDTVRAPSDRPQGNLCLESLTALKMCYPHLAENKYFQRGRFPSSLDSHSVHKPGFWKKTQYLVNSLPIEYRCITNCSSDICQARTVLLITPMLKVGRWRQAPLQRFLM